MTSPSIDPAQTTMRRKPVSSATIALLVLVGACIDSIGAACAQNVGTNVPRTSASPATSRPAAATPSTPVVKLPPPGRITSVLPPNFYVVTLGDSIMWGQGIPDGSKFRDLVVGWLQSQFGAARHVIQIPTHAHSGARILPANGVPDVDTPLSGEIPNGGAPSLWAQTALTATDLTRSGINPASVNLVLLDGGINDIGITFLLDPLKSTDDIDQYTQALCVDRMQALLPFVIQNFPNAAIVVTGYFPIVTTDSDMLAVGGLLGALGIYIGPLGGLAGFFGGVIGTDQIVAESSAFAATVVSGLTNVVQQTNAQYFQTRPGVALAWPGFGDQNGYHASSTYLWDLGYFAIDEANGVAGANPPSANDTHSVAWYRANGCAMQTTPPDPLCVDASMGHPNLAGVAAYASAIEAQLAGPLASRIGLPPPPPPPPSLLLQINWGVDFLGPTLRLGPSSIASKPVKLTHWLTVTAFDRSTGTRRAGTVRVQRAVSGQTAFGSGAIGTKLYYKCKAAFPPLPSPRAVGPITPGGVVGCTGVVSVPGFPEDLFAVPGDASIMD
jgi:hypothetical protein